MDSNPAPPTATDIFRYRYQHGTNLGSIFVLEKWLHPKMFDKDSKGSSELEATKQYFSFPLPIKLMRPRK